MKKMMLFYVVFGLLLAGWINQSEAILTDSTLCATAIAEEAINPGEPPVIVYPLPDATMENLTDAILSVSLEEGDVYLDDTGKLQMNVTIYTYDAYDLVEIALLQVGDRIVTHAGEVDIISIRHLPGGTIAINGGWEEDGLTLMTDDSGFYYAIGANDAKSWYEIGKATIRVSVDFQGYDQSDFEMGEVVFYPGSFLVNEVTNYDFTPYNTTIRIEEGQVVELHRMYMP